MKKTGRNTVCLLILTVFVLCCSAFGFSGAGSGTESDPYLITTVEQLQEMNDDLVAYYELGNDIDASVTQTWNGGAGFEPVGDGTNPFTGKFGGHRHTITGLHIDRPSTDFVALFGYIAEGAEVKDVGVIDADMTGYSDVGALVGYSGGSRVCQCYSSGQVRGIESGYINSRVGGLVARSSGGSSILRCYSSANVTSNATQVGGLSGYNGHGSLVIDCYATGDVSGYAKVGGLVGDNLYPEGGYVSRCYSTGKVSGTGGGLIGYNFNGGVTYDSYWDIQTSGKTSSRGGTGKETADMMRQATFVNWDFVDVWDIIENESYPFLRVFAPVLEVAVDIKPGSCPNPLNPASRGVLPVAILGTEEFDVSAIDATSVRLQGVGPVRSSFEDVSAPADGGEECPCGEEGPDGHMDLTLKFKVQELVQALAVTVDDLVKDDVLTLNVTGVLTDETGIEGADCVIVVGPVPKSTVAKRSDANGDGVVDMFDFALMAQNWLEVTTVE
jgi:hypothetical protein